MFFKKPPPAPPRRTRTSRPNASIGPVFSYHANRSVRAGSFTRDADSQQQQASPKRRSGALKLWIKRLPILSGLVFILAITFFCLRLSDKARIVPVGADKGHIFLRDMDVYTTAAQQAFAPLSDRNKLTVNTATVTADLERQFPELKAVSVSLPVIGDRPVVYIQPTAPELILVSQQGMFLLDSNGRALIRGNQVAKLDQIDIPVITDQSNLKIEVGQVALPRSTMNFIREVAGQLKAKGLTISSLVLPSGGDELQMHIQGVGYLVKYNLYGDAREEAGAFLATKQYLDATHRTPGEYVDVRVENRAYYR